MEKNSILLIAILVIGTFTGLGFLSGEFFQQSAAQNHQQKSLENVLVLEDFPSKISEHEQEYNIEIKN